VPARPGHEEAPLEAVEHGDLAAVVSAHAESIPGGEAALWRHEEVVESLMAATPVLPMRFGAVVAGREDVHTLLEREQVRYRGLLEEVRGRVELGVRVMPTGDDGPPLPEAKTGEAYLMHRLERNRRAAQALQDVHAELAGLAVRSRLREAALGRMASSGAYLVEAGDVERFSAAVERVDAAHPELAVLLTGPWPPYTFVGDLREGDQRVGAA
jgi:hypothetical protein